MPAKKKLTPQQQRDRKAKVMLGALSVVLVAVLGFELPSMMGGSAGRPTAAATTSTDATAAAAAGSSLAVATTPQSAQLTRFARFSAKNPFSAPRSVEAAAAGGASSGGGGGTVAPAVKTKAPAAPNPAGTTPPAVTFTGGGKPAPVLPQGPMVLGVVMQFNGKHTVVAVGSEFPQKNPVFKLVAVGRKAMWISLVGGSFGAGNQTLKIMRNHSVKLVNTTISASYLIRLLKVTTVPKPTAPAASTVPTTTAATTTSSTTTTASTTTTSGP